jgi:D-alanyl-D-alanine carboxypeptidase/D-alanyl-D-alanine-endopeptidase (penicillin-binding protein 4)
LLQKDVKVGGSLPQGGTRVRRDLPVVNPAALFGSWLKQALERSGVSVAGSVRVISWPAVPPERAWRELGFLESLPMSELAREVQKPSQNLYTDLLLAQLGERSRTTNTPENATSEELGIAELNRFLRRIGIAEEDVHFEEASGLSRNNLTTARATIALLQYMSLQPTADVYWAALPLAGVDGTLRNRFKGTKVAGNMEAKTGTLRWSAALSGRLRTAGGEPLLFSFMLNRYAPSGDRTARAEIDALTLILAEDTGAASAN